MKRAAKLHAVLDVPAKRPQGLDIFLFTGDAEPTLAAVVVNTRTGRLRVIESAPGDGTVLRSALMDEWVGAQWRPGLVSPIDWSGVTFLFSDHLGMTSDPLFSDNLLFLCWKTSQAGRCHPQPTLPVRFC